MFIFNRTRLVDIDHNRPDKNNKFRIVSKIKASEIRMHFI